MFSYSRNAGAKVAAGDFVVFIDGDDIADVDLLSAYARHLAEYQIMGGRVEERSLNDADVASWRYEMTRNGLPLAYRRFPFFIGCNCAISRGVFERIGWFDESRAYGGEEIDFCIRANLAGYDVGWVPDAVVHYRHRATITGLSHQFFAFGRADVTYFARHQKAAALQSTGFVDTLRRFWPIIARSPSLVRGRGPRGHYLRHASYTAGTLVESIRRRVWYIGG